MNYDVNLYNPQVGILSNQEEGGIPRHTMWDVYAEQHNPIASANHPFTPNTQDAYGGAYAFTDFSPELPIDNPDRLIVWNYNQNYQGIAPMELQPQFQPPDPWEVQ